MSEKLVEFRENRNAQISILSKYLYKGKLLLVLGAGVSIELGLPSWSKLVERLCIINSRKWEESDKLRLGKVVELLRSNNYGGDERRFRLELQKQLYLDYKYSFSDLLNNSLMPSLVQRRQVQEEILQMW